MIDREKYTIDTIDNGVIRLQIKKGIHFIEQDLRDINQIYRDELKITNGRFLIVLGEDSTADFDIFKLLAKPDRNNFRKAEAIVVHSVLHNVESDYFIKNFKVGHPIKIFDNEEDALIWLKLY